MARVYQRGGEIRERREGIDTLVNGGRDSKRRTWKIQRIAEKWN
jgi:hypothetical protein